MLRLSAIHKWIFTWIFLLGATVAISQDCPVEGPEIVVTGGYYPLQWNRPIPDPWRDVNPAYPPLEAYDPGRTYAAGTESFTKIATLQNPAAIIKIGVNAVAHVAARHLFNSSGNGSKFNQKYSEPLHLLSLINYVVTHTSGTPANSNPNVLYYTSTVPDIVGSAYGYDTNRVTVSVYNTGKVEDGLRVFVVTNMYPGDQ